MNRDSRASKPEDDATGKLLDELLSDKDCLRIQVIRRTDVLRFVDLTTLERTIGLEMPGRAAAMLVARERDAARDLRLLPGARF